MSHGDDDECLALTPKTEAYKGTKIDPELTERFRIATSKVAGVLDPEITDVFQKVLRAITE